MDNEFDAGSGIEFSSLTQQQQNNLTLLGKVWGFLKYHHPAVAQGKLQWDYELFRFLSKYLEIATNNERDLMLLSWINSLGEIAACQRCQTTDQDSFLKPDHRWITESLSPKLQNKLNFIYQNRYQGKQKYIASGEAGNPDFSGEQAYNQMANPDAGYRLLALFRYWNMIHYFFPYKHLVDRDWSGVLADYIPLFIEAKSELAYEKAVIQLIGEVHDTHANVYDGDDKFQRQELGSFFPPVHTKMVEGKLVVTDYYTQKKSDNAAMSKKSGLNIGDVITKIDGVSVENLIKQRMAFYPASNYVTKLRNLTPDLLRSTNKNIAIEFVRDSQINELDLTLYKKRDIDFYRFYRKDKDGESYRMLEGNIGYVTLKNITEQDVTQIKKEFINTAGIIIDIRNYPNSFVPLSLGSYFIDSPAEFAKFTEANFNNPGEFILRSGDKIPVGETTYKGKVVVLVNEISQSQAEYTAMAFRAGKNTTIIGSTTAGADGNTSTISLPGQIVTYISGLGVYYPDGTETQRVGIVPDVEVLPTIAGIKAGRDEVLEKAIEVIKSQ